MSEQHGARRHARLARYLCAAVTADQMGVSPATELKRLPEDVGKFWYKLAELTICCLYGKSPYEETQEQTTGHALRVM